MKIYQYEGKANICGENIYQCRKKQKLSQKALSVRLQSIYDIQISQKSISRIELGERFVADYELIAISKILKVNVEKLCGKLAE